MQTEADPLCQPAASLYAEYEARQTLASQAHELSREDLRRTWSVVDVLTSLKRNTSHSPTAALIRRKLDALPLPAIEKLGCLVDLTILQRHGHRLSTRHYHGFQLAISSFPDDTATEIARAHSCREVISAAAIEAARLDFSHVLRLGIESITTAQKRGIPLHPIATDRHVQAMTVLQEGKQDSEAAALEVLGIEDAVVLEGRFLASSRGLLTGTAFCLAVLEQLEHTASICCGRCGRVVDVAGLSICRRCGDQLVCKACGRGCGRHDGECDRVRGIVRAMAESLLPSLRESARHVAVVQLDARGGMVPIHISSIGSPLTPSSLWDTISRSSDVADAVVYWRLLVAFLAEPDGDEQVCILGHEEEDLYRLRPVECATVEKQPASPAREAPTLPSERRRLRKERKAAEKRAQEEARAAAEAAAVAEADAVLERQAARADATSAMLTSVLLKRGGTASPEVVARTRAKRDSLKAVEMRARKPTAKATPKEPNAADRLRTDGDPTNARLAAAALLLQRRARTWLGSRKKLRRKQRSRAAKLIQRSVRTWLLLRVAAKPYITSTAVSSGSEGAADGEELVERPKPEPPRPAATDPTTTECAICLDGDAEYAVVPCGHRCLCCNCSNTVTRCPVCRTLLSAVLRVFV